MKKRRILGVLLALGMILGMSLVANAASVSSVAVKEITLSMMENWENDNNNLTIDDLSGFQKCTLDAAKAWSNAPSGTQTVYLIYEIDGSSYKYTIYQNGSYKSMGSGSQTHKNIYNWTKSGGDRYFYTIHTHSYEDGWSKDSSSHWHACKAEGASDACQNDPGAEKAAHSYGTSGDARFTCSVCKYENSTLKAEAEAADKKAAEEKAEAEKKAAKEKAEADQKAADAVIDKIKAIGTVSYTDACKTKIDAARTAYDALSADQKKLVTNSSTLTDAEKKYDDLKNEAEKKSSGGTTTPTTTAPKTAVEQPTSQEKITISKAPKIKKLRAKKNKVQVTWNKIRKNKAGKKLIKQIKYIEIQAARDPEFQNIVATKNVGKKKSKTVLKLGRKTTYFVRVRYVGNDGVSKWSKVKKIKTK